MTGRTVNINLIQIISLYDKFNFHFFAGCCFGGRVLAAITLAAECVILAPVLPIFFGNPILIASVDELWNFSARLRPEAAQSSDASGIIHLTDQSKFPAEGEGPGPEGLDPGDYMADLEQLWQRGLLDEHGAYTQAGAEWLAGIMAQTEAENQEGAEAGGQGQSTGQSGGEGELAAAYAAWAASKETSHPFRQHERPRQAAQAGGLRRRNFPAGRPRNSLENQTVRDMLNSGGDHCARTS